MERLLKYTISKWVLGLVLEKNAIQKWVKTGALFLLLLTSPVSALDMSHLDLDSSQHIDLRDAVMALQVNTAVPVDTSGGDGKIGIEDAICLLQYSGMVRNRTAVGTYTWNAAAKSISMNWIDSDFTCDGPETGTEMVTQVSITSTTMTWPDGCMTWHRSSGTANSIIGTWTTTDITTGNSLTLTFNADGTVSMAGVIVQCDDDKGITATGQHGSNGYFIHFYYRDPSLAATAVRVSGPGITGSMALSYNKTTGEWGSSAGSGVSLGKTFPVGLPYTYTFAITDVSTWTATSTVSCFQEKAATIVSPTGVTATADNGQITIRWNAVDGAVSYNIYWSTAADVTKTSGTKITLAASPYSHMGLANNTTYYYVVTAVTATEESSESAEVSATPGAGWVQTQLNGGIGRSLTVTDTDLFAATYNSAYSTADDGMPWFSKGPAGKDVSDVIKSSQYILAATLDGVYRSSDDGKTWAITAGSPGVSAGGGIYGPHVFAKNSTHVFIIAWARGIFRSADNGKNWKQVFLGKDGPDYQDYAASASFIYAVGERIFINGNKPHDSWTPVIWSSANNGDSWTYSQSPSEYSLQSLYHDNGKLFAAGNMGVYLSTDLGHSWTTQYRNSIDDAGRLIGLGNFRQIVSYNQILIATIDSKSIYLSRDNGITWTSFSQGLIPDWTFTGLAIKPPYIWALTGFGGNAYRRPLTDIK